LYEPTVTEGDQYAQNTVTEMTTKASEPEKVHEYMGRLKHPLAKVVEDLRQIILSTHKEIGEEIKWNAPTFFSPTSPETPNSAVMYFKERASY
jgi:hypothetical protein